MSKKESFTKKTGPTKASPKKGAEKKIAAKKPTAKGNDKAHTSEASVKESLRKVARKAVTAKKAPPKKNLVKENKGNKKMGNNETKEKMTDEEKIRDKGGYSIPAKGKIITMEKNDSDEDSLNLDNDEGLDESLAEARKVSKATRPLLISVSGSFVNVADGKQYSVIIFPKPGNHPITRRNTKRLY